MDDEFREKIIKIREQYDLSAEFYDKRYRRLQYIKFGVALSNVSDLNLPILDYGAGSGLLLEFLSLFSALLQYVKKNGFEPLEVLLNSDFWDLNLAPILDSKTIRDNHENLLVSFISRQNIFLLLVLFTRVIYNALKRKDLLSSPFEEGSTYDLGKIFGKSRDFEMINNCPLIILTDLSPKMLERNIMLMNVYISRLKLWLENVNTVIVHNLHNPQISDFHDSKYTSYPKEFIEFSLKSLRQFNFKAQRIACAGEYLPIRDNSINTILSFTVIQNLADRDMGLREIKRIVTGKKNKKNKDVNDNGPNLQPNSRIRTLLITILKKLFSKLDLIVLLSRYFDNLNTILIDDSFIRDYNEALKLLISEDFVEENKFELEELYREIETIEDYFFYSIF